MIAARRCHFLESRVVCFCLLHGKRINGFGKSLVFEIKENGWIHRHSIDTSFKVQMRTCGTSRISTEANDITSLYGIPFGDNLSRKVTIHRFGNATVDVFNHHVIAITTAFITHLGNHTCKGCSNRIAYLDFDINSFMDTVSAHPKRGGHTPVFRGHVRLRHVNKKGIGKLGRVYSSDSLLILYNFFRFAIRYFIFI